MLTNKSAVIGMFGPVHSDLLNVPQLLLPFVHHQITLRKSLTDFYAISSKTNTWSVFRFLDAKLHVRHVKPSPTFQLALTKFLEKVKDRYDVTSVTIKYVTFRTGSKSLSTGNAVLGILPKRLLFTMLQNVTFTCSADTNTYHFTHFSQNRFLIYANRREVPSESISPNTASANFVRWPTRRCLAFSAYITETREFKSRCSILERILCARLRSHARQQHIGRSDISRRQRQHPQRDQIRRGCRRGRDYPTLP